VLGIIVEDTIRLEDKILQKEHTFHVDHESERFGLGRNIDHLDQAVLQHAALRQKAFRLEAFRLGPLLGQFHPERSIPLLEGIPPWSSTGTVRSIPLLDCNATRHNDDFEILFPESFL
jgi:hypothetical protein